MLITNTIITKQATAETSTARYQFEYTISEGKLVRVFASIFNLQTGENQDAPFIGNISLDNNVISCSLPRTSKIVSHFEDFDSFLVSIQADVKASLEQK